MMPAMPFCDMAFCEILQINIECAYSFTKHVLMRPRVDLKTSDFCVDCSMYHFVYILHSCAKFGQLFSLSLYIFERDMCSTVLTQLLNRCRQAVEVH